MSWKRTEELIFKLTWDLKGYKNLPSFIGELSQKDWNQTLVTRLNELSAQVYMSTLIGPGDTVESHSCNKQLIEDLEYYTPDDSKIGKRFDVIFNDEVGVDDIYVYIKQIPENLDEDKKKRTIGVVTLKK